MSDEDPEAGEYVRTKADIQLGEGVDRRGSIEFEMQQEINTNRETEPEQNVVDVPLPNGGTAEVVNAPRDDIAFARFVLELQRRVQLLRDQLRLHDDGEEDDGS